MLCSIKGKEYIFTKDVRENETIRQSFNQLAQKTFGINFEPWFLGGYWKENYIPYALLDGDKVVANVSVNPMEYLVRYNSINNLEKQKAFLQTVTNQYRKEEIKRYVQLGTVMTDSGYRKRGLSSFLIEKVMKDWKEECDSIFLFANESALDFYPKFGFHKTSEYHFMVKANKLSRISRMQEVSFRKLDISNELEFNLLKENYQLSNPYSKISCINNFNLLMFYCSEEMKDCVYYIDQFKAVVIAEFSDNKMICYDIFGENHASLEEILVTMLEDSTEEIVLGFTPYDTLNQLPVTKQESLDALFILGDQKNLFENDKIMFPLLSHT